jgi:hypothetical protein
MLTATELSRRTAASKRKPTSYRWFTRIYADKPKTFKTLRKARIEELENWSKPYAWSVQKNIAKKQDFKAPRSTVNQWQLIAILFS